MQLHDQELAELKRRKIAELREKCFAYLQKSGGVEVICRSAYVKFDEQSAHILDVLSIPDCPVRVLDQVVISSTPDSLVKWGTGGGSGGPSHEYGFNHRLLRWKIFRIVAFVELTAKLTGNVRCSGYFCILAEYIHVQLDESSATHENHICQGQEVGLSKGKVKLYPIECLVPVPEKEQKYN